MQQRQLMGTHLAMPQLKCQPYFGKEILRNSRHNFLCKPASSRALLQGLLSCSPWAGETPKATTRGLAYSLGPHRLTGLIILPGKQEVDATFRPQDN